MPANLASIQLGAAVAAVLATAPVAAQEPPLRFEFTPYAGYRIGGEFEPLSASDDIGDDSHHFALHEGNAEGLLLDILTREGNTQWEALYAHQSSDSNPTVVCRRADARHRRELFQFGGTYLFDENSATTVPFIALTAGLTRFEPGLADIDAENYLSWSLGGGVQLRADRRIGVDSKRDCSARSSKTRARCSACLPPPSAAALYPSKATCFISSKRALASWDAFNAGPQSTSHGLA